MTSNEHRFIGALARRLPTRSAAHLGDDAALVDGMLATVDILVEGIDFRIGWGEPGDLGWKAIAANVSDIAAMAGTPRWALVSLTLGTQREPFWVGVYDGIAEAVTAFGMDVVGGDVSAGPVASVSVTVIGEPGARTVWRSGASSGDGLYVGGPLGAAAAGLAGIEGRRPRHAGCERAFLRPCPQVREGAEAAAAGATAMIDLSDGLAGDALRLAEASSLGVEVDVARVPLAEGVDDPDLALYGGEDFVLAFGLPEDAVPPTWARRVGRFLPSEEGSRLLAPDGTMSVLEDRGWDHLR